MKAIVAIGRSNRVIGKNGGLPWPSIKEDFKWFRKFTLNKTIVIGSTTYRNLPALSARKILVLSKNYIDNWYNPIADTAMSTVTFDKILKIDKKRELIVAGGASIYKLCLPYITEFYVTHVNGEYDGDTFMPPFEQTFNFNETIKEFDKHRVVRYYN